MKKSYVIERLKREEMPLMIDWAAQQGWNPGLHDASCFYQADPNGFFAGKLAGQIVAIASAVVYDEQFAFCGLYIVDDAFRGQGYGLALTQARLAYIGQRNAGLDGVLTMADKYARLGYKAAHKNIRYCGRPRHSLTKPPSAIVPLSQIDFAQLLAYDRRHFPANREAFLKCWIKQPQGRALGYVENNQLRGYTVIRACQQGFKFGPLFADTPAIAEALFVHGSQHAHGAMVSLDIPENNPAALELVTRFSLTKLFEVERMYLKGTPALETNGIYGITSYELG